MEMWTKVVCFTIFDNVSFIFQPHSKTKRKKKEEKKRKERKERKNHNKNT